MRHITSSPKKKYEKILKIALRKVKVTDAGLLRFCAYWTAMEFILVSRHWEANYLADTTRLADVLRRRREGDCEPQWFHFTLGKKIAEPLLKDKRGHDG